MSDLLFSKEHCWVQALGDTARIGITDFAQKSLGKIYFINLCDEDDELEAGDLLGDIESRKTVSDIISPIGGTVSAVNDALLANPGELNASALECWLAELENPTGFDKLMSEAEYCEFIKNAPPIVPDRGR